MTSDGSEDLDPAVLMEAVTRKDLWLLVTHMRQVMALQGAALAAAINKQESKCNELFGQLTAAFNELDLKRAEILKGKPRTAVEIGSGNAAVPSAAPAAAFAVTMTEPTSTYRVGIVGESFRPAAIARCSAGDPVELLHEAENRYDPRAVAVHARGQQIGYLPRDGWLTRALLDEQQRYSASILEIFQPDKERRFPAVVLEVQLA